MSGWGVYQVVFEEAEVLPIQPVDLEVEGGGGEVTGDLLFLQLPDAVQGDVDGHPGAVIFTCIEEKRWVGG